MVLPIKNSSNDGLRIESSLEEEEKETKNYVRIKNNIFSMNKMVSQRKDDSNTKVFILLMLWYLSYLYLHKIYSKILRIKRRITMEFFERYKIWVQNNKLGVHYIEDSEVVINTFYF